MKNNKQCQLEDMSELNRIAELNARVHKALLDGNEDEANMWALWWPGKERAFKFAQHLKKT